MIPPKPRDRIELCRRHLRVHSEPQSEIAGRIRVVVGVAVDKQVLELERCLVSIADQQHPQRPVGVVLLVDRVGAGDIIPILPPAIAERAWLLSARCGSAARARNAIIEFVESSLPLVRWIARMDSDDRFAGSQVLQETIDATEAAGARWALAGNQVLDRDGTVLRLNRAERELRHEPAVLERLSRMADGTAENELPSCNLVFEAGLGLRYPHRASAEDHWLVADLLLNQPERGLLIPEVVLTDYTLDGPTTERARRDGSHARQRRRLLVAAQCWQESREWPGEVLGRGGEGVVRLVDGQVIKCFYPFALDSDEAEFLGGALVGTAPFIPQPRFTTTKYRAGYQGFTASYEWKATRAFDAPGEPALREFLGFCMEKGLVCLNIKRPNLRIDSDGQVIYIDVGRSIRPMDVSYFRDSAARLFSIGVHENSDEDLLRRPHDPKDPAIWGSLGGYQSFLREIYEEHGRRHRASQHGQVEPVARSHYDDVSLMIKACPMDAAMAEGQVRHIVEQLEGPPRFMEKILLIDPFEGPFTRQHARGELGRLRSVAEMLRETGVVDRVLEAPTDAKAVREINERWFGLDLPGARTRNGVPVAPQLAGFERVRSRYLLQCDLDVLIGRRDLGHDYLEDMLHACARPGVLGVAFNIPHDPVPAFRPYDAPAGEFVPEVRCGLLDLERITEVLPLPNSPDGDGPTLTWYRALQQRQHQLGLRTLRGGHHATFYLHPPNPRKQHVSELERIRGIIAGGWVPPQQLRAWDLEAPPDAWAHPPRHEGVIVVARGRNTPSARIRRFAEGLAMQEEQHFGVIVVDDASTEPTARCAAEMLRFLGERLTLVRNSTRKGTMQNQILAVREICTDPESLIVIVDLDDALFDKRVIGWLHEAQGRGHDVVLGAPYRPDRPAQVYQPSFDRLKETYGGDVWIHLRSFRKRLFDLVPDSDLQLDGKWLERCNDYATMIPVVRLAKAPTYIPRPMVLHERSVRLDDSERAKADEVILRLLRNDPD